MGKTILTFGTRPELIKILPIISEFKRRGLRQTLILVHTQQHQSLVERDMKDFQIKPDYTLTLNRQDGNLNKLVGNLLLELNGLLDELSMLGIRIDCIIGQGDTASTYASSLVAFHASIPFFHVEAGLRSGDLGDPFPEEFYRKTISAMASFHFAPTDKEKVHLMAEGVDPSLILVTGNTVIDNLRTLFQGNGILPKRQALITLHRRKGHEDNRGSYIGYFQHLALANPSWEFLWLMHPGARKELEGLPLIENLSFISSVSYAQMLGLYAHTAITYTDSGGIQEECAYLGIPCMIARGVTERKQGLERGLSHYLDMQDTDVQSHLSRFKARDLVFGNEIYGNGESAALILDQVLRLRSEAHIIKINPEVNAGVS